mmetsp:Transcript_5011/g.14024  ORF Transcript_5011/g.14024 Transcript_5011/m.14024 type:complete len:234 (-) Transcript_5011:6-707(-)
MEPCWPLPRRKKARCGSKPCDKRCWILPRRVWSNTIPRCCCNGSGPPFWPWPASVNCSWPISPTTCRRKDNSASCRACWDGPVSRWESSECRRRHRRRRPALDSVGDEDCHHFDHWETMASTEFREGLRRHEDCRDCCRRCCCFHYHHHCRYYCCYCCCCLDAASRGSGESRRLLVRRLLLHRYSWTVNCSSPWPTGVERKMTMMLDRCCCLDHCAPALEETLRERKERMMTW